MLAFLGMLPVIGPFITGCVQAYFNAKVSLVTARIGGDRDVAVKLVGTAAEVDHNNVSRLAIFISNKLLLSLVVGFAIPIIWFEWKVVVWDTMLGWGSTPPIKGQVADWMNTIIYCLFGTPAVMGLGKMWFGRNKAWE